MSINKIPINVSLSTKSIFKSIFLISIIAIFLSNCNPDNQKPYANIPDVFINYDLNLNLPQFSNLTHPGGFVYIDNEGYKGIIVYHKLDDNYVAIERTCTYQPLEDCSKIYVDDSGLYLRCGENDGDCCESKFEMDGTVLHEPAIYPLKTYNVLQHGDFLSITNSF